MLRAPELRPGEAGAATQAKPLTSFLIQDILRDGGPTASSQPRAPPQLPRQPVPRQHPEPEPEEGRGGAGAQEDERSARPCAARVKAEPPAETESGKPVKLGGWAAPGGVLQRAERPEGCAGVRAGPRRTAGSAGSRDAGPLLRAWGPHRLPPRTRLGDEPRALGSGRRRM